MFIALNGALLQGFTIARFSKVLVLSGYTSSPEETWKRFRNTGWAILDWISYPLDEPKSDARQSLYTVRCMHAFARKQATQSGMFDKAKGEGIALSQYDLAEVLLGFSVVCLSILEHEFCFKQYTYEQRQDMCVSMLMVLVFH